jgi:hypothetical protein
MSNFTKRKWLNKEDLEEIVNNSENSEFNDEHNQSYDSDIFENISKPISFESQEDDCSNDMRDRDRYSSHTRIKGGKEWPHFSFIGLKV